MAYHDDHECDLEEPHGHVEDFGAVGDGKTDDGPAIQRALNACKETGATVKLQKKTYAVGAPLHVKMFIKLGVAS